MIKIIFPTDEHVPYDDPYAVELAMKIAQDFQPDIRIAGSDGIDFYAISAYDKDPKRLKLYGLQREIDLWIERQKAWRTATPTAQVHYIVGNHEDRLRRYLWKHPELHDLEILNLENILKFAELGILCEGRNLDYAQARLDFGPLTIKHGHLARKFAGSSVKAEMEAMAYSRHLMIGHVHRGSMYTFRGPHGPIVGAECFCLCRLDPEYVPYPNWQHGIAMATVDGDRVSIELVPFHGSAGNIHAFWRDKHYRL